MKRFALVPFLGGAVHGREIPVACLDVDPPERLWLTCCACGCGAVNLNDRRVNDQSSCYQLVEGRYVHQDVPPAALKVLTTPAPVCAVEPQPQPVTPALPAPASPSPRPNLWHLVAQFVLAAAVGALLVEMVHRT